MCSWNPVINDGATMLEAIDVEKRYKLSFWDAMIVVAAPGSVAYHCLSCKQRVLTRRPACLRLPHPLRDKLKTYGDSFTF